eukprot:m.63959 g.63959  ORF g.63959 m.63959 type:complete len:569 (+) comp13519_c0_seq1:60-1766(+)
MSALTCAAVFVALAGLTTAALHSGAAPTVAITPAVIGTRGGNVTVSFDLGGLTPSRSDWFGLYLEGEDPAVTSPIKYLWANRSPSYMTTGKGSWQVHVVNMRADMVAMLFRNGTTSPQKVATSNTLVVQDKQRPMHFRLSVDAPDKIRITTTAANADTRWIVKFGLNPSSLASEATASASTYSRSDLCGAPATTVGFRDPGMFLSAVMDVSHLRAKVRHGARPASSNTMVYYSFGSDSTGFSEVRSFQLPPGPGEPAKIVAFGDLGQFEPDGMIQEEDMPPSLNTTRTITALDPTTQNLILHIGDISYARGYVSQWEHFHNQIEPMSSQCVYMTGIGNHERDWPKSGSARGSDDSGGECGVAYETRFPMPRPGRDQPWYSFDIGVVHFVLVSTEHDFSAPHSAQYKFVASDLAAVDRTKTPWVVFAGHRPYYIDSTNEDPGSGDQPVATELRDAFEQLLMDHKVDFVFGAHHHSYQRTCPVFKGKCVAPAAKGEYAAPIVVDIGMAGAGNSRNVEHKTPDFFVFVNDSTHGFTRIDANATSWSMEYICGATGKTMDAFTVSKLAHTRG